MKGEISLDFAVNSHAGGLTVLRTEISHSLQPKVKMTVMLFPLILPSKRTWIQRRTSEVCTCALMSKRCIKKAGFRPELLKLRYLPIKHVLAWQTSEKFRIILSISGITITNLSRLLCLQYTLPSAIISMSIQTSAMKASLWEGNSWLHLL